MSAPAPAPASPPRGEAVALGLVQGLPYLVFPFGELAFPGGVFSSDFSAFLAMCFGGPLVWTLLLGLAWLIWRQRSTALALLGSLLTAGYWAVRALAAS